MYFMGGHDKSDTLKDIFMINQTLSLTSSDTLIDIFMFQVKDDIRYDEQFVK